MSNIDSHSAWKILLELRRLIRRGTGVAFPSGAGIDSQGRAVLLPAGAVSVLLVLYEDGGWRAHAELNQEAAQLFELYLPVCLAREGITVGHLGQSLDGRIATANGASCYVTGLENILHLHRMRALCEAVVVGAETVRQDNPRLTTRRVAGLNPVRVVLDPKRRLQEGFHVFQDDAAPTLLFCDRRLVKRDREWQGQAEIVGVPLTEDGRLVLAVVLKRLHERGLLNVFVEGGGITVSHFLREGLLDRLQVAIAPLIIGSGRPGISLPAIEDLSAALRPRYRPFRMGEDILFDCWLR